MRQVYLWIFNIVKKSPDCIRDHYTDLIFKLVSIIEELLQKPSLNNTNYLKYAEAVQRLLSLILENFKGRNTFSNEIIVRGFVALTKYLFIGTVFQDKIMKNLTIHQEGIQNSDQATDQKEEAKDEEVIGSDNDSLVGSTYTDSISQDVLLKGKTWSANALKSLFKFGQKTLFNYRHWVVPSFIIEPTRDFIKFCKGIFNEEWNEFYKCVDDQIYKEPSFLYLFLTEADTNFKMSIIQWICSFIMHSPIEKWQGPLERDELTSQYQGFKYELADSKSSGKVLKLGGFIPLSQLIAHFVRYFHYLLIYLINRDNSDEIKAALLKLLSITIQVTPYKKMSDDLLKWCMIPHISEMINSIISDSNTEINQSIQKNLLLWFSAGSLLLFPIMINIDSSADSENIKNEDEDKLDIIRWLLTDLHENSVKKSFEAIDTLTTIAENYPWIFIYYWAQFKDFINIIFSINETRKTVAVLKLIESWISSISSQWNSISLAKSTIDEDDKEENDEETKTVLENDQNLQNKIDRYNILNLDGCTTLLNKYLNFFLKSDDTDTKVTVINILNVFSEKQWEEVFTLKERQKIITTILTSKIPKAECSNFIGHIFLIRLFYEDLEYTSKLIDKLYYFKNEKSLQIALRNWWSLGNLWENWKFDALSEIDQSKISDMLFQYSSSQYKEKPVSHSVRAVGQIFANCKDFSSITNIKGTDWKEFFMIIVNNISHKSPKVSWNSWVLLRSIMDNDYMRWNVEELLFSKTVIKSLWSIIKENANFKTRIHAVQTLNTFR